MLGRRPVAQRSNIGSACPRHWVWAPAPKQKTNKQINKATKTNQPPKQTNRKAKKQKNKKPTSHLSEFTHPTTKLQRHLMFYSAKEKGRHTCWLLFLLLPAGINTTSESSPLQEGRNLLICQLGTGGSISASYQKDLSF